MSVPTQHAFRGTPERAGLARPQALAVGMSRLVAVGLAIFTLVEAPTNLWNGTSTGVLIVLPTMTVGALLVTRLPRHIVGWLLLAGGLSVAITNGFGALADYGLNVHPGSIPGALWFGLLGQAANGPSAGLLLGFVPLYFPTGHLPSPRWWPVIFIGAVPTALPVLMYVFSPFPPGTYPAVVTNPLALGGAGGQLVALLGAVSNVFGIVALVCVIASLVVRYRRSDGIERAQLKWFAAVGVVAIAALVVAISTGSFTSGLFATVNTAAWLVAVLGVALLPLAIGIAILRYRLYEIDRLISRTIGWGVLTVILGGVFVGLVLGLQAILAPLTRSNELAVAGSTLLVAALFQPLRRRVQGLVDRRFNRSRYDAQVALDAFSARLRDEVDLDTLQGSLLTLVEATLEPTSVGLWLRD